MKSFVLCFNIVIFSCFALAVEDRITLNESQCSDQNLSTQSVAHSLLRLISLGGNDGRGNSKCFETSKLSWTIPHHLAGDGKPKQSIVDSEKNIEMLSVKPVSDSMGNLYRVEYEIENTEGKTQKGEFTFSRVYTRDSIEMVGCGFIQHQPTVSFLLKECQ